MIFRGLLKEIEPVIVRQYKSGHGEGTVFSEVNTGKFDLVFDGFRVRVEGTPDIEPGPVEISIRKLKPEKVITFKSSKF